MKPLNLKETALKEEMKERCLAKGQYIDENAKAKFEMLCHLEDFEVQYWELQQENKKLNGAIQTYDILLKSNVEENKQLKEQLLVTQTNEETFRLEMEDITKTLGLDEDTIFDDVKVYARNLKDNWIKLKEIAKSQSGFKKRADLKGGLWFEVDDLLNKMKELEQESDCDE